MTTILIVLALLSVAVGIVLWATRKTPTRPHEQRLEQDTAWNDPVTPAGTTPADPFAAAPKFEDPRP